MRAVSQFNRQGEWSEAIQISIRLPPPPLNITAAISGVPTVQTIANEMFRVSGEVVFEWLPADNLTEEDESRNSHSGYVARVLAFSTANAIKLPTRTQC